MEGIAGLAFTWDPRTQEWVKERGPEDAASPFVPPVDAGALQTFFLDTHNGRWTPTVLGVRARQIMSELGRRYRAPATQALAFPQPAAHRTRRRPGALVVVLVVLAALVLVVVAAQLLLDGATPGVRLPR